MYKALYRAERPEVFSEIIGQDHIVRILKHQIETDSVSHAYLFCGTRGTGKTTTARILAKAVNCENEEKPCGECANCLAIKEGTFLDVIEIDAASNNGVENIRELRESVNYPPSIGKKKVYIIDEVHMLSAGAFNALLKTLEEPPENVMFILATTDPQKLPQTILSRCMRLDFKRVSDGVLKEHMRRICQHKGVEITDDGLRLLVSNADGSVRDGLSILEQCMSAGDRQLDRNSVLEFLGTVSEDFFIELTDRVLVQKPSDGLVLLDRALREGKDVKQIMKDWMSHYRNLLITKYIKNPEDMLNMSQDNIDKLKDQCHQISLDEINDGILTLSRTINDARYSTQPRILLELAIVSLGTGMSFGEPLSKSGEAAARKPQTVIPATAAPKAETVQDTPFDKPNETKASMNTTKPEERVEDLDLEEFWNKVLDRGETVNSSMNMMRSKASIAGIKGSEVKLIVRSEFDLSYVERNKEILSEIMGELLGRAVKIVCVLEGAADEPEDRLRDAEKIASQVKSKFNIDVRIE